MPVICLLLSHIPCVADPSWSLNSRLLLCYHLSCYYFRPVSCMLPFVKTSGYAMTYPDYYYSLDMTCCLLHITILLCYHSTPSMIYLTLLLSRLRESCLVTLYGTKCHTEQSATSHTWWGPPLESVGATSRIHPLRTKCHTEQSATSSNGGGHLLNPWGPPLESAGLFLLFPLFP